MDATIEATRKFPNTGTLAEAQRWIATIKTPGTAQCECRLEQQGQFFVVRWRGQMIGAGLDYHTAIANAEGEGPFRYHRPSGKVVCHRHQ